MRSITCGRLIRPLACLALLGGYCLEAAAEPHQAIWDALLREYVSTESRVDYARLRSSGKMRLDAYVADVAKRWPADLAAPSRKAALINAYNALTVGWILANYPVESIWRTKRPFREARHTVDGKRVSLDGIETELRGMGDPLIHAALVCAARGCPPLRREAYVAARLETQLEDNARAWLANPAWNEFAAARNVAEVSKIFDWYGKDFERTGGVAAFLAKYAPAGTEFLREKPKIRHKTYQWGLNDSGGLGERYSQAGFWWDVLRNR